MAFADLEKLFRTYRGDLIAFLRRRGVDSDLAADIAQDVFVRVMRVEPAVDVRDARAYLYRTAANLVIDHRRREIAAPFASQSDSDVAETADPDPSVERAVMDREELARLARAIDTLPPRCREVFLMARVDAMPQVEIARALNLSHKTVSTHMARALVLLKIAMSESDDQQS